VIVLEQEGELVFAAGAGDLPSGVHGQRMPIEGTVTGRVLRSQRAERVVDARSVLSSSQGLLGLDVDTAMLVPLAFRGRSVGVLAAFDHLGVEAMFDDEDERLLGAFAASAATAVATGRSVEEQRLRQSIEASEHERRRWARELHDETLQSLAGLRVGLSTALRGNEPELRAAVEGAVENVGEEIANLRTLIVELRPAALDEYGAGAAIESLAERTAGRQGIAIDVHAELARHSPELESTVYRLVQEALTNAVRHAGASHVGIRVTEDERFLHVAVSDDGSGFDPAAEAAGFGLLGMRERVALAAGEFAIETGPGGTTVRARLPVRPRAAEPK
jgi:signal transduction histidine kinase